MSVSEMRRAAREREAARAGHQRALEAAGMRPGSPVRFWVEDLGTWARLVVDGAEPGGVRCRRASDGGAVARLFQVRELETDPEEEAR